MSAASNTMQIKAIFLPENMEGEDITGTAPFNRIDSLQEAAEDVTFIVMASGRFVALNQPLAAVEAALEKAVAEKLAVLDITAACMNGDAFRERLAAEAAEEDRKYAHQQRVIARWMRRENAKGKKSKATPLTEADIRGIQILKDRIKQRALEATQAKPPGLIQKFMAATRQSLGKIFTLPAKKPAPAKPVTEAPPAVTVEQPAATAPAPEALTPPPAETPAAEPAAAPAPEVTPAEPVNQTPPASAEKPVEKKKKPAAKKTPPPKAAG